MIVDFSFFRQLTDMYSNQGRYDNHLLGQINHLFYTASSIQRLVAYGTYVNLKDFFIFGPPTDRDFRFTPAGSTGLVNQKNFGLFFTTRSDMQAAQLLINTGRTYKSVRRIILSKV